ncbi:hypothetical protein SAMN05443428_10272 [Caloramator quimbayensis]|uniref:Uncharacterized protein n=1 Tax=Caloramator quimbayensis TaxID=1147123 RepID=A0A1T4WKK0_9CLOT|nr:hypothetical protein [Caloramator quimbayensis]SKA77850.1 hypothetical protein SAMN05443428_10272 [Caloramator quimbayensis]
MKKFNNYINLGLLFNAISIVSYRFNLLPSFIEGLCTGLGIAFIFLGLYAENHSIEKFKSCKKYLLNKALGK